MPEEREGNQGYFAVVREKSGRYISQRYEDENDFRNQKEKIHGLVIETGISQEAAEKICLEYNDRHFPIVGLEKWMI